MMVVIVVLVMTVSPYACLSQPDVVCQAALTQNGAQGSTSDSSLVKQFQSTDWKGPISQEDRARILADSQSNIWSTPSGPLTGAVSYDMNQTTDAEPEMMSGQVATASKDQNQPVWSEWPWQDSQHIRKYVSALPRAPNMEGHSWLQRDYSTLSFEIMIPNALSQKLYVWIWLVRASDTYARFLTISFDNQQVDRFPVGSNGFKGVREVPSSLIAPGQRHTVSLSINYCGYVFRGWRLEFCWVGQGNTPNGYDQTPPHDYYNNAYPMRELLPRSGLTDCMVEYKVIGGYDTYLNIVTDNVNDYGQRVVDVYVDNQQGYIAYWGNFLSPGSYVLQIGSCSLQQQVILRLVFRNMPDISDAKRITTLAVHCCLWFLEIDHMPSVNHDTVNTLLTSMNAWLMIYGYHRVYWIWSTQFLLDIPFTTTLDHEAYFVQYYDHKFIAWWEYVVWANRLIIGFPPKEVGGWHLGPSWADLGIAISYCSSANTVIWHEYGHHIGIVELGGSGEVYCENPYCVMFGGSAAAFYYCWYHWHLRLWA